MLDKAKHYALGAAKLGVASMLMAATDLSRSRVSICNSCEQLSNLRQCSICHCFVDQKAKYAGETCPLAEVFDIDQNASPGQVIYLHDKWGMFFGLSVRSEFANRGDIVMIPDGTTIINVRTKERSVYSSKSIL